IRAPNEKDVMRFKIDQQEVDFTLANFCTTLRLPIPTSEKLFDQPSEFLTIAKFIKKIGYVGELENLTQFEVKKLPQPWQTLFIVLNLPKLFVELYHYVYNDDLVAKMFATSAKVQEVIGHPVELQTEDIMRTEAYQVCVEEYGRSPKPKSMFQKLKEKIVGELSEPQKPIQIKVKHLHLLNEQIGEGEYEEKVVDEDDEMTDDDDHIDHTLIRNKKTGSMETRNGKMQTPIPTPPRFFRNDLSSNKATFMELMDNLDTISEVLRTSDLPGILKKVDDALHVVVPKISIDATNKSTFGSSFANVTTSSKPTSSSKSQVVHKPRTYAPQLPILDYDDTWIDNYDINDGVFISENADIEFMAKIQGIKWVPTTVDYDKMKFAHNNILKSQCRTGARLAQVFKGCARDPNAPERYLFNKDLFFLRNGNTEAKNYIISLYKFHATLFPEDDLNKLLKRWLGVESYRMKINLTDPTITYTGIEKYSLYSIIDVPFVGIVYENNKKEKRAMDIDDLHKFSDATLKRVLRKISMINREARHGIIKISLSDKDKELMALHEEKIKERLKYRDQMRRCESLVNGRQITNYMVRPE
ncbi:hypothetical protein Tco_0657787, partial [Tanacetum coccineum]